MDKPLSLSARLVALLRGQGLSPMVRNSVTVLAVLLLGFGTWVALSRLTLDPSQMRLAPLLWLIGLGVPATVLLNTVEMELSAAMLGKSFGPLRALRMTIFASAANMLPLPGAAMVRVAGLGALGGSFKAGGSVTLMIALMWMGVAFLGSGAFLFPVKPGLASVGLAVGLALTITALIWSRRISGAWRTGIKIAVLKSVLVGVSVFRIYLCLAALGLPVTLSQVSVFAISGVLGSAVSIVPAGLGVREAVSAALAPLVALPAAGAFLATALDRVVTMTTMLILAGVTALFFSPKPLRDPSNAT